MTEIRAAEPPDDSSTGQGFEKIQVEVRPDPQQAGNLTSRQMVERFQARAGELGASIGSVAERIRASLEQHLAGGSASDWELGEVSLQFSVSLEAETGVLISKVSSGATFQVSLTWSRGPGEP
ncbi:CU044_2847 family protein [Streptomyces sp. NPDC058284]|uniref:CU044_2847 family protein n=1 Tax=unclassified Streptomyces TaxID=2593676 RepID=UPI00366899C2